MNSIEDKEIWKDIDGFDGYQVSNLGRVRSWLNNRYGVGTTFRILSSSIDRSTGYDKVSLWQNGKQYTRSIHRLVADVFCEGKQEGYDVNHIDGDKTNNRYDNLEWCSRGDNMKHAYKIGLSTPVCANKRAVKIVETGEMFESLKECAKAIDGRGYSITMCLNEGYKRHAHKGLHFEYVSYEEYETYIHKKQEAKEHKFLYPHQEQAIERMFSGCILNGGTGSGKSRTGVYYYFWKNGGKIENREYTPMTPNPPDLYIITTAKKKHDLEWEEELIPFHLYPDKETKRTEYYGNRVVIDSWQCLKKYADVRNSFFIFDEDKLCGTGAWAKAFLKIAKHNEWIILSATSGDTWQDYETVFIANGFFRTRTEFRNEHLIYSRFTNYPQVTGYRNETRLIRLRDKLLIDMDFERHTIPHHEPVYVQYDVHKYKEAIRTRWDPFKNEPITQASGLCYVLRKIVNSDDSRQVALLELFEQHPRMIVFYSFDYERDILLNLAYGDDVTVAEYSGHAHEAIPETEKWVYVVNYSAGAEGFNCVKTDCIVFFSQTYSYKVLTQACGRIDRLNTPFRDLFYYHIKSRSGIDLAIAKALDQKKRFNERKFTKWDD